MSAQAFTKHKSVQHRLQAEIPLKLQSLGVVSTTPNERIKISNNCKCVKIVPHQASKSLLHLHVAGTAFLCTDFNISLQYCQYISSESCITTIIYHHRVASDLLDESQKICYDEILRETQTFVRDSMIKNADKEFILSGYSSGATLILDLAQNCCFHNLTKLILISPVLFRESKFYQNDIYLNEEFMNLIHGKVKNLPKISLSLQNKHETDILCGPLDAAFPDALQIQRSMKCNLVLSNCPHSSIWQCKHTIDSFLQSVKIINDQEKITNHNFKQKIVENHQLVIHKSR